jgi:hypothetical protein
LLRSAGQGGADRLGSLLILPLIDFSIFVFPFIFVSIASSNVKKINQVMQKRMEFLNEGYGK